MIYKIQPGLALAFTLTNHRGANIYATMIMISTVLIFYMRFERVGRCGRGSEIVCDVSDSKRHDQRRPRQSLR